MKNQYWIHLRYHSDGKQLWELTQGRYANKDAVEKAYEARGKALGFTILDAKPHEQFEFRLN